MSKVKVSFSVSIDGFGAAPQQSLENPMGVGGEALGEWVFATWSLSARRRCPSPTIPNPRNFVHKHTARSRANGSRVVAGECHGFGAGTEARGCAGRENGSSLNSTSLTSRTLASSVYVHVP